MYCNFSQLKKLSRVGIGINVEMDYTGDSVFAANIKYVTIKDDTWIRWEMINQKTYLDNGFNLT